MVIAPHSHTGNYEADPYYFGPVQTTDGMAVVDGIWQALPYFNAFLLRDGVREQQVYYYTYVEDEWKTDRGLAARRI